MSGRLLPFQPNWSSPVEVELGYKTDIVTSRSGQESRRSLRSKPRRQVGYSITLSGDDRRKFARLLSSWQGKPMSIGDPTRSIIAIAAVTAGSGSMTIASFPPWLTVGAEILIAGDHIATVTAVTDSDVSFTPVLPFALAIGTLIRPLLTGRLTGAVQATHPTSRVAQANIRFAVDVAGEMVDAGSPLLYTLDGREMFMWRPNWRDNVDQVFDWPVEQVDFGHGRVKTFQPTTAGVMAQSATFLSLGAQDAGEIESFLQRMRGRRGEFLMSTDTEDMIAVGDVTANSSRLSVVVEDYEDDDHYKSVAIRLKDGRLILRTIANWINNDGFVVLEMTQPFFYGFTAAQVAKVSWLQVFRFSSDDTTFEWRTSEVATLKLGMRTLPNLPAERPVLGLDEGAQWMLEWWGGNAGAVLDPFDRVVNVRYPAIYWHALPWVMTHEKVVDHFDFFVNTEIPESIG